MLSRIATVIEANRRPGPLLVDLENGLSLQVVVPLEEAVDRIRYEGLDVERAASMLWDVRGFVGDVEDAQAAGRVAASAARRAWLDSNEDLPLAPEVLATPLPGWVPSTRHAEAEQEPLDPGSEAWETPLWKRQRGES